MAEERRNPNDDQEQIGRVEDEPTGAAERPNERALHVERHRSEMKCSSAVPF